MLLERAPSSMRCQDVAAPPAPALPCLPHSRQAVACRRSAWVAPRRPQQAVRQPPALRRRSIAPQAAADGGQAAAPQANRLVIPVGDREVRRQRRAADRSCGLAWLVLCCAAGCVPPALSCAAHLQIVLETGEIGRQASGAVMATDGETVGAAGLCRGAAGLCRGSGLCASAWFAALRSVLYACTATHSCAMHSLSCLPRSCTPPHALWRTMRATARLRRCRCVTLRLARQPGVQGLLHPSRLMAWRVPANICAEAQCSAFQTYSTLQVHYTERFSAAGRTSGGYLKREGKPKDHEVLVVSGPAWHKGVVGEQDVAAAAGTPAAAAAGASGSGCGLVWWQASPPALKCARSSPSPLDSPVVAIGPPMLAGTPHRPTHPTHDPVGVDAQHAGARWRALGQARSLARLAVPAWHSGSYPVAPAGLRLLISPPALHAPRIPLPQVLTWVMSYDGEHSPEPLAITAAGAALAISGASCYLMWGRRCRRGWGWGWG